MKSIRFESYLGPRLPRNVQLSRLRQVVDKELTPLQKETLVAYYFQQESIPAIAARRGVNKSTVSRTLKAAERRLKKYLKY